MIIYIFTSFDLRTASWIWNYYAILLSKSCKAWGVIFTWKLVMQMGQRWPLTLDQVISDPLESLEKLWQLLWSLLTQSLHDDRHVIWPLKSSSLDDRHVIRPLIASVMHFSIACRPLTAYLQLKVGEAEALTPSIPFPHIKEFILIS